MASGPDFLEHLLLAVLGVSLSSEMKRFKLRVGVAGSDDDVGVAGSDEDACEEDVPARAVMRDWDTMD